MENRYKMLLTTLKKGSGFLWFFFVENKTLISSHLEAGGGGCDPADIRGHKAAFVNYGRQFQARDGGLGLLLYFRSKIPGERLGGFVLTPPY